MQLEIHEAAPQFWMETAFLNSWGPFSKAAGNHVRPAAPGQHWHPTLPMGPCHASKHKGVCEKCIPDRIHPSPAQNCAFQSLRLFRGRRDISEHQKRHKGHRLVLVRCSSQSCQPFWTEALRVPKGEGALPSKQVQERSRTCSCVENTKMDGAGHASYSRNPLSAESVSTDWLNKRSGKIKKILKRKLL